MRRKAQPEAPSADARQADGFGLESLTPNVPPTTGGVAAAAYYSAPGGCRVRLKRPSRWMGAGE